MREVIQHLREPVVLDARADRAGDRGAHAQRHHIAQGRRIEVGAHVHRVEQIFDGLPEEEPVRHVVQLRRELLEAAVAVADAAARREAVHAVRHRLDVLGEVDLRAVVEEAAPLRIEAAQVERFRHVPAGLGEDALEHARHGEDGRPHVEAEAALVQHGGLAADPAVLVEHGRAMTARGEHAGSGKAAEPAADHRNRLGLGHTLLTGPARRPSWSAPTRRSWRLAGSARPAGRHRSRSRTVRSAGRTSCRAGRCR